MLFSYYDCIEKYKNDYQLNKAIKKGEIFKIESGIYSDSANISETKIIIFKYHNSVFTMNSAFYYYGLTDVIPDKYHLATVKDAYKITDKRVKQYFHRDDIYPVGISEICRQGINLKIYDKERMLIELIRSKSKLPFDYYKEIIESYRKIINEMDIEKLQEYLLCFPKQESIFNVIQLEVL